jgi:farnesyl-diphosphate farnesyltransferase
MAEWNAEGLSQEELMIKDQVIIVDNDDKILGSGSKKETHVFSKKNPRGILHRAFSVFLFNSEGKLLLQQRASEKITFPDVWTNTCCSHPLYGLEVDSEADVAVGNVDGAKKAAVRKLKHELGIEGIRPEQFKYLTRLHYWAADVVTHGPKAPWGEHEIDYILFAQVDVPLNPHPEEVRDTKYVNADELRRMMKPATGNLWSPWFRIIADKFLVHWWSDLKTTISTDKFVDYTTIHRFDPTSEHMGGAGNAKEWLGNAVSPYGERKFSNDSGLKQGGYGKVKIHKHSKIGQIVRLDEVYSMLSMVMNDSMESKVDRSDENVRFCDDMLGKVSRSFASVIRQLPRRLCTDIMVFYLALRALDTIEDDMEAFKGKEQEKIQHLNDFYKTGLVTDGWSMDGVGEGDEKVLLQEYYKCVAVFSDLPKTSQDIIADITKRMGQGMAGYVEKDLGQGTVTLDDYYLYCHYVAGLVGEGLSRLFSSSGYESPKVASVSKTLANDMGLFLQKTNIIRDYLEDYVDGRAFWPKEVWGRYTKTDDLGDFARPESRKRAVALLNHLITDALRGVPTCLEYMKLLKTEENFRFCAIPQVMAIATLSELYNNPKVFTGVVKIRKGLACKLILDTSSVGGLHRSFYRFATSIMDRVPDKDPNAEATRAICQKIRLLTFEEAFMAMRRDTARVVSWLLPLMLLGSGAFIYQHGGFKMARQEHSYAAGITVAVLVATFVIYMLKSSKEPDGLRKADQ